MFKRNRFILHHEPHFAPLGPHASPANLVQQLEECLQEVGSQLLSFVESGVTLAGENDIFSEDSVDHFFDISDSAPLKDHTPASSSLAAPASDAANTSVAKVPPGEVSSAALSPRGASDSPSACVVTRHSLCSWACDVPRGASDRPTACVFTRHFHCSWACASGHRN
jgi:hypothetical protein